MDVAIEIRLTGLAGARATTISGTVSGMPPGYSAHIGMSIAGSPERRTIAVTADGKFTIPNLPQGVYRLTAYATGSGLDLQSQTAEVRPDGSDKAEVQLALSAGVEVTGKVEISGDPQGKPVQKRTVTVGSSSATTEPDGSFQIGGIFPDRYRVSVQPLPDDGYIQSVDLDGSHDFGTGSRFRARHARVEDKDHAGPRRRSTFRHRAGQGRRRSGTRSRR